MENITDMEFVGRMKYHLEFPCGANNVQRRETLLNYIELSESFLNRMSNPFAKTFFKSVISDAYCLLCDLS